MENSQNIQQLQKQYLEQMQAFWVNQQSIPQQHLLPYQGQFPLMVPSPHANPMMIPIQFQPMAIQPPYQAWIPGQQFFPQIPRPETVPFIQLPLLPINRENVQEFSVETNQRLPEIKQEVQQIDRMEQSKEGKIESNDKPVPKATNAVGNIQKEKKQKRLELSASPLKQRLRRYNKIHQVSPESSSPEGNQVTKKISKNIPKNIFKGIIKYMLGKKTEIYTKLASSPEEASKFMAYIKRNRNNVLTLLQLKQFLTSSENERFARIIRVITYSKYRFFTKDFVAYIYNSKIKCRYEHLSFRPTFLKMMRIPE